LQIEALALRAIAHNAGGDEAGAFAAFEKSLSLADPSGFIRLYVDLDIPKKRLTDLNNIPAASRKQSFFPYPHLYTHLFCTILVLPSPGLIVYDHR
jgi:hypothetical protein